MPRQDVPYGGALCRLKERIAEIWDELGKKLHSINGVEGDAAGDVKIVSGDAAVVVTSDQVNHEIEIALDTSQLPAASVASVNGQTGAVVLDASDINVIGGSDVATELGNLDADLQQAQTDIATEALTRANADSVLQTNINAATAGIPTEISNQLAADTTIVRTSGNQNIADVKTVATQATGSYSQQIANSQKVKNELDNYAPMVRTTGNQNISGVKTFTTANGITLDTTKGYNGILMKANGSALGINFNDKSNDVNGVTADRRIMSFRHFYGGGDYDTYWLEVLPRNPIVDSTTTRASGGIEIVIKNDNVVEFNLFAYTSAGTISRHKLSKFDGTNWS